MKQSNYLIIAHVGAILGAIFLFAGEYTGTYYEFSTEWIRIPYAQYAPSLIMCGIISLIISAFMWRASEVTPIPFNIIMKRLIAYAGVALGATVLVSGLYAGTPLIITGVVLLTAGIMILIASKATPTPA